MTPRQILDSKFKDADFPRIIGFGSSNTQRRIAGMHWLDCFDLACHEAYGALTLCINSGIGGNTTKDMLDRIERDCLSYKPHVVFITVGGNDSFSDRKISREAYRKNYMEIVRQIKAIGALPIIQTYYSADNDHLEPAYATAFAETMQTAREVAAETDAILIDHLSRWEPLRKKHYRTYLKLMEDPLHVNAIGNLVLGLDIAQAFALPLSNSDDLVFREAQVFRALLDELAQK